MIETLRIENVAIVERAELEFGPGLNVLTGETGAGKSMVLCALELLAGGRASPELLREGCDGGQPHGNGGQHLRGAGAAPAAGAGHVMRHRVATHGAPTGRARRQRVATHLAPTADG